MRLSYVLDLPETFSFDEPIVSANLPDRIRDAQRNIRLAVIDKDQNLKETWENVVKYLEFLKNNDREDNNEARIYHLIQKRGVDEPYLSRLCQFTAQVEQSLEQLKQNLLEESQPLAILVMMEKMYDRPHEFIAHLLWLLQQNLSTDEILKTKILHQFYDKYKKFNQETNPDFFKQIYLVISFFPGTAQFSEEVKKVSATSADTGVNLLGLPGENLRQIAFDENRDHQFTLTQTNIARLINQYDVEFLSHCLRFFNDDVFYQVIVPWFNALLVDKKTEYIDKLARWAPDLLEKLRESSWEDLMEQYPHAAYLIDPDGVPTNKLRLEDLQRLIPACKDVFLLKFPFLMSLCEKIWGEDLEINEFLTKQLLNLFFAEDSEFITEEHIARMNHYGLKACISEHIRGGYQDFIDQINQSSLDDIETAYQLFEDRRYSLSQYWQQIKNKPALDKHLFPPLDVYTLAQLLIKKFASDQENINIGTLVEQLAKVTAHPNDDRSAIQQREKCIWLELLAAPEADTALYRQIRDYCPYSFTDTELNTKAASYGHVSYFLTSEGMSWLQDESNNMHMDAIKSALARGQGAISEDMLQHLEKGEHFIILREAYQLGNLACVIQLCNYDSPLSTKETRFFKILDAASLNVKEFKILLHYLVPLAQPSGLDRTIIESLYKDWPIGYQNLYAVFTDHIEKLAWKNSLHLQQPPTTKPWSSATNFLPVLPEAAPEPDYRRQLTAIIERLELSNKVIIGLSSAYKRNLFTRIKTSDKSPNEILSDLVKAVAIQRTRFGCFGFYVQRAASLSTKTAQMLIEQLADRQHEELCFALGFSGSDKESIKQELQKRLDDAAAAVYPASVPRNH